MTRAELDAFADDLDLDLIVADGFDDCILGVAERFNETFVLYDYKKVIEKLMSDGMSVDEAEEYYEFNIAGAFIERGPAFVIPTQNTLR